MKIKPGANYFALNKQNKRKLVVFGGGILIALSIYMLGGLLADEPSGTYGPIQNETVIPAIKKADDTKLYRSRLDNKVNGMADNVQRVEDWQFEHGKLLTEFRTKSEADLLQLKNSIEALKEVVQSKMDVETSSSNISENRDEIFNNASLGQASWRDSGQIQGEVIPPQSHLYPSLYQGNAQAEAFPAKKYSYALNVAETQTSKKKLGSYLPRGTYINAKVIGGVDASVAMDAQREPLPVLLRLTDLAQLPNHQSQDFVDCRVLGAAHGDNSSERVYIRTVSLSCTKQDGEIIDSNLAAYIAGPDSKAGVRGVKVMRELDLITNAALSSMFGAGGEVLSQSAGTTSISPLGSTKTFNTGEAARQVLSQGANETGGQLSKYFIERAKSYEPVIELPGGTDVTLVLTEGFSFNDDAQKVKHSQPKISQEENYEY